MFSQQRPLLFSMQLCYSFGGTSYTAFMIYLQDMYWCPSFNMAICRIDDSTNVVGWDAWTPGGSAHHLFASHNQGADCPLISLLLSHSWSVFIRSNNTVQHRQLSVIHACAFKCHLMIFLPVPQICWHHMPFSNQYYKQKVSYSIGEPMIMNKHSFLRLTIWCLFTFVLVLFHACAFLYSLIGTVIPLPPTYTPFNWPDHPLPL